MATFLMTMIENAKDCTLCMVNFNTMWDIDGKTLDRIHSYTFTIDLSANYSTMSLQYKEKDKTIYTPTHTHCIYI